MAYVGAFGEDLTGIESMLRAQYGESIENIAKNIDTKHLPQILKNAEAYANQYLGVNADKAKKQVFEYLYLQSVSAANKLLQTTAGKFVSNIGGAGFDISGQISVISDRLSSKEPMDTSGVVDMASAGKKIVGSLVGLGLTAGVLDKKLGAEIMAWTDVAMGCAAAASALSNPYVAAGACALQFVSRLIKTIGKTDDAPPEKYPRAIFVPSKAQMLFAATDAERLAAVLKYKYGVQSYAQLLSRITGYTDVINAPDGTINEAEYFTFAKYPAVGSTSAPLTGVDLRVALALMRFNGQDSPGKDAGVNVPAGEKLGHATAVMTGDGRNPWTATRHALSRIAATGEGGKVNRGTYDRDLSSSYIYDHDVCVQVVDVGANWWKHYKEQRNAFGLDAFKRVHELINFFSAITKRELSLGQKAILQYVPGQYELPVRLYAVNDQGGGGCRHDFYDTENCEAYGKQCITSLERCNLGTNECNKWYNQVFDSSRSDHDCAVRQLGALRLMAAFSFMQYAYMHSYAEGLAIKSRDMVAALPNITDPSVHLNLPVEINYQHSDGARWPRTTAEILSSIKAKASEVAAIKKMAESASKADQNIIANVSTNVLQQFYSGTKTAQITAGQDPMQQLIQSGALQLQTLYDSRKKCRDDGGAWSEAGMACIVDANGKLSNCTSLPSSDNTTRRYYCVPSGTPGSVPITNAMLSSLPGSGGSSLLPIIAIAGAGFLLMQLMKK